MAFPTTPEETLKYYLFKVMSEEDATRFMSFKEALPACEAQEPKWQAVYALCVHLHVIGRFSDLAEFTYQQECQITQEQVNQTVRKFLDSFSKSKEQHGLFLILLLYSQYVFCLKKEDEQAKIDLIKQVIEFEISTEGYPFVGYGKLLAANMLIPILMKESNHKTAVEAMAKVAECLPNKEVFEQISELVGSWLRQCEAIPLHEYTRQPGEMIGNCPKVEGRLVDLLDAVANVVEICPMRLGDDDVERLLVEESSLEKAPKESAEYWTWELGYVLGRLSNIDVVVRRNLLDLCAWGDIGQNANVVASLLFNYEGSRNWKHANDVMRGMALFRSAGQDSPAINLQDVPPTNPLYWAMRIGFADGIREKIVAIVPQSSPIQKLEKIETITSSAFQWQIKGFEEMRVLLQGMTDRLPPSPEDIETYLLETLDDTFDRLPLPVRDHLKQAELDFKSGIHQSNARVEFVKTVEAALDCLFTSPLRSYYKQYKLGWPFTESLPNETNPEYGIRKWGEQFCKLAQPMSQQLGNINQPGINRFLKDHYPNLNYCELEGLGKSLQDVQKLRGGSAHYQSQFPLNKEIEQLKELRKMVLGLEGHPSIIKQMVELFGNKRGTA